MIRGMRKKGTGNREQVEGFSLKPKKLAPARGQAMLSAVLFILAGSIALFAGIASPVAREITSLDRLADSKQSFVASEAVVEDVSYRIKNLLTTSSTETVTLGGATATATITTTATSKSISAVGDKESRVRTTGATLVQGYGVSFQYGVHAGLGGFVLGNTSSVNGNVYSNGPITGSVSRNAIYGDAFSAGPSGLIQSVHPTGSAYANRIQSTTVDGDAYYQTISGSTVAGAQFPGSIDPPIVPMPISDDDIDEWKAIAAAGGTYSGPCPYVLSGSSTATIGPIKIPCDLRLSNSAILTVTGPIWVSGNFTMVNSSIVKTNSSVPSGTSIQIVVDNPSDRLDSSLFSAGNSSSFDASASNSHFLVVSRNNSAETGGSTIAASVGNSAIGDLLLYVPHGEIRMTNNASLYEAAAYRIRLVNTASITYESGLADLLFSAGPSGEYTFNGWGEQ